MVCLCVRSISLKMRENLLIRLFTFFRDDDTFFPDYTSLVRLLASYDSAQDVIIGALSETYKQVEVSTDLFRSILEGNFLTPVLQIYGHMAYGGAGIFVSRTLMAKMNGPGHCKLHRVEEFDHY